MALSSLAKDEIVRLLNELPPDSLGEVRQFIARLKVTEKQSINVPPVSIRGWLKGYHFTADDIALARAEMWARFQDSAA